MPLTSLITVLVALIISSTLCLGETSITLDGTDNVFGTDTVFAGGKVKWVFRLTFAPDPNSKLTASTNGFKVWTHRSSVFTDAFAPVVLDTFPLAWNLRYDMIFSMPTFGVDGIGEDTVAVGGAALGWAFTSPLEAQVWWIETTPFQAGDTLCVDSATYYSNPWVWAIIGGLVYPDWSGPHCYHVAPCCRGNRGNADMITGAGGPADIADLTVLVYYLFRGGQAPPCPRAGDANNDGGVNVLDVTYLVDWMFLAGPDPAPCP